jgi:hypothetical protein
MLPGQQPFAQPPDGLTEKRNLAAELLERRQEGIRRFPSLGNATLSGREMILTLTLLCHFLENILASADPSYMIATMNTPQAS